MTNGRKYFRIIFMNHPLNFFSFLIVILLITFFLPSCTNEYAKGIPKKETHTEAIVTKINSDITIEDNTLNKVYRKISYTVKILNGTEKNNTVEIIQNSDTLSSNTILPVLNQKVFISDLILSEGETSLQIADYRRYYFTFFCILLLVIIMILSAGKKGLLVVLFTSLISGLLYLVLFPMSSGINPVLPVSALLLMVVTGFNFYYYKTNSRFYTLCASNILTLLFTGILSFILFKTAKVENLISNLSLFVFEKTPAVSISVSIALLFSIFGILQTSASTSNNYFLLRKKFPKISKGRLAFRTFNETRNTFALNFFQLFLIMVALLFPFLILRTQFSSVIMIFNSEVFSFFVITYLVSVVGVLFSSLSTIFIQMANPNFSQ